MNSNSSMDSFPNTPSYYQQSHEIMGDPPSVSSSIAESINPLHINYNMQEDTDAFLCLDQDLDLPPVNWDFAATLNFQQPPQS